MGRWALFFGLFLAAAVIVLLIDRRRQQHERMYAERMRRSMLYYEIFALVTEARRHEMDRVLVERDRIVFYAVYPPGKIGEYVLRDHGHRPLNPQRTYALVQALTEDLPILQDGRCYRFRRFTVIRPNGRKDHGYEFIIRSHYKAKIMYAQHRWVE